MNRSTPARDAAGFAPRIADDRPHPWYRHRWPWLIMFGPAAVVVAGAITIWIAFSRQDALVVDDYYKQGKAINQDLRRDRAAASLGMVAALRYEPAAGRLAGRAQGIAGPETGLLLIQLVHPTQPEKDIRLQARPDTQGGFSVALPMLEQGNWQVQVENAGRGWRLHGAWTWPRQHDVTLKGE